MNAVWSENIQGTMTLYLSRKLRFDDLFFERYRPLFCLDRNRAYKILEIGCGPGALAEALHRWYPNADIIGIDRDTNFIAFAKEHIEGVTFVEGDVTALPFEDNTFDINISNTVQEHIEPSRFWGEQRRVLKPDGVCLCLSARKGITRTARCLEMTDEERTFWSRQPDIETEFKKHGVCRYPMAEDEIALSMAAHGFRHISTGYAVIDLTPDNPPYAHLAKAMIEANRQCDLEAIRSTHDADSDSIIALVNKKYDERLQLLADGKKQWDTEVSVTMVLRGIK